MERGDPDAGVGVVGHGDEFTYRVGVDQVVEKPAAALPDGKVPVVEAGPYGAHRVLPASQQLTVCHGGALGVAQARDQGCAVGPDESEHGLSVDLRGESGQRDFRCREDGRAHHNARMIEGIQAHLLPRGQR
ncbi:hypothetical protein ABT187_14865 [Streptomyces sp. NPDC001817]|uniref:hypothetical protein n=1 Tax=Streptomyces sp. NPDC001817 TaxID=3154398 RepID=UPI003316BA6D